MNSTNCTRPVSVVKLKNSTRSSTPMRMAPSAARGNETIPPISAAAKPRSRVSGPMCTRSADDWSVAVRKIAIVARNPAIAHTPVDTIFGLMPVRREVGVGRRGAHGIAERGVAEQPPETDGDHRDRDQHEELACAHLDVEERQVPVNGSGNCVCNVPVRYAGSECDRLAQLRDPDGGHQDDHAAP